MNADVAMLCVCSSEMQYFDYDGTIEIRVMYLVASASVTCHVQFMYYFSTGDKFHLVSNFYGVNRSYALAHPFL